MNNDESICKHNDNLLEIIILGGIEEFGSNCTLYIYENHIVIVDYGISIHNLDTITPYTSSYIGLIDFINSNFTNKKIIILITHCHDDHISGLSIMKQRMYKNLNLEVYVATQFNKDIIISKTRYTPKLIKVVGDIDYINISSKIKFKFMKVTHSIPDSYGISIFFDQKHIFHSGDWTINSNLDEITNNMDNIEQLNKIATRDKSYTLETMIKIQNTVDIMINESTRINNLSPIINESIVLNHLRDIILQIFQSNKHAYITMFSSNIERIANIIDICIENSISICFCGSSIDRFIYCAFNNKYITSKQYKYIKKYKSVDDICIANETIKLVTGCQNEENSVLNKMVCRNKFLIKSNHIVIFSCSQIPTQKKRINIMHNKLTRNNIKIITNNTNPYIHCGGHGNRKSFEIMYKLVNPKVVIPEHGEIEQLEANSDCAHKTIGTKKILPSYCKSIIFNLSQDNIKPSYTKIYKYNSLSTYVSLDYNIYNIEDNVIKERLSIIKGGIIIINTINKSVNTIGCTICRKIKKYIIDNINNKSRIDKILRNFTGIKFFI